MSIILGISVFGKKAMDVIVDIFEDIHHSLNAIEYIEHPKGIKKQEKNHDRCIDRLGQSSTFKD